MLADWWVAESRDGAVLIASFFLLLGGMFTGAAVAGSEWRAGTITTVLTWEPRRVRLNLARTAACGIVAFAVAVVLQVIFLACFLPAVLANGTTAGADADWWLALVAGDRPHRAPDRDRRRCLPIALATLGRNTAFALGGGVRLDRGDREPDPRTCEPGLAPYLWGENIGTVVPWKQMKGVDFTRSPAVALGTIVVYTSVLLIVRDRRFPASRHRRNLVAETDRRMDIGPKPTGSGRGLDAVLLTVGTLLAIVAAVVLVAQYRPVLFRHDTEFIGLSLAILAGFAAVIGFRVGRRTKPASAPRLMRTAAALGTIVAGLATTASVAAVIWYRAHDGIGWPRIELGVQVLIVGGLAFAAVFLGGWTRRWWRPLSPILAAGLFLAALITATLSSWALEEDFSDQRANRCVVHGTVTYCHYAGYAPFVDEWARVIDAVLDGAPRHVVGRPLTVQQATKPYRSHLPRTRPAGAGVAPWLEWSPGDTAPFALAIETANWVTGRVLVPEQDTTVPVVVDQGGRGVVAFWLAAQATDRSRRGFEYFFYRDPCGDAVSGNDYVDVILPQTIGPIGSDRYAAALLKDPEARRKAHEHWAELTGPQTTASEAGLLLGIEPEPEQPKGC